MAIETCDHVFGKIADGRYSDPKTFDAIEEWGVYATLAKDPAALGHTLVVPVKCIPDMESATGETERALGIVNRATGIWLKAAFHATDVDTLIAGRQVPHLHIHRLPITTRPRAHLAILGAKDPQPFLQFDADAMTAINERATFPPTYRDLVLGQLAGDEIVVPTMMEMAHDLAPPLVTRQ